MTTITTDLEFVTLDPAELLEASNVRKDLGDLTGLVASVRELGVLQPVLVEAQDGSYRLVTGFRRAAAAREAGRSLPAVVRPPGADVDRIVGQLAENLSRADLTAAEEAAAYEQLRVFGLDEVAIAERVGRPERDVQRGLQVASAPKALAITERYELTLEEAAALAEFEDDRAALKGLTVALKQDPERFPHALSQARQEREDRAKREEIIRNLGEVPLIEESPTYEPRAGKPCRLADLRNPEGKPITPAKHRKCPGHAAYIEDRWGQGPTLVWVCTDPLGNGHRSQYGPASRPKAADLPEDEREKASAERREVVANNKAWRAATPVRGAFLEQLGARARAPKGALRYAVSAILLNRHLLAEHGPGRYDPKVLAATRKALAGATDAQLAQVLMGAVCEAMESALDASFKNQGGWRRPATGTAAYLEFLASAGYALSDVEQVAVKADRR